MVADPSARERFIPIRKADLVDGLANSKMVTPEDRDAFFRFSTILNSLFHFEFHAKTETLKENYYPFNPDNDTVSLRHVSHEARKAHENRLMAAFKEVLNQANYQQLTATDLTYAMNRESLFKINLLVDFEDFENQLVFRRGAQSHRIERRKWLFKEETIDITAKSNL